MAVIAQPVDNSRKKTLPNKSWYVRVNPFDELFGPLAYQTAISQCIELSLDEEGQGVAELCTYVGARPGDPADKEPTLFVKHVFLRGVLVYSGRQAEEFSRKQWGG